MGGPHLGVCAGNGILAVGAKSERGHGSRSSDHTHRFAGFGMAVIARKLGGAISLESRILWHIWPYIGPGT